MLAMRQQRFQGAAPTWLLLLTLTAFGCSDPGSPYSTPRTQIPTGPTPLLNNPPIIRAATVTPFVVSGLAPIQMSATAVDPENDSVTFQWTFGTTTFVGADYAATVTGDGPLTVTLRVTDAKGAFSERAFTANVGTMTGRWNYIPTDGPFCGVFGLVAPPILILRQEGRVVTGDLQSPTAWCNVPAGQTGRLDPAAPGSIDETGAFKARLKVGSFLDGFLTAQMDTTGRQLTGTTTSQGRPSWEFSTFTLRKL